MDAVHREAASKAVLVALDKRVASELVRSRSKVTRRAEVENTSELWLSIPRFFAASQQTDKQIVHIRPAPQHALNSKGHL
jgi:hypothetical protein